MTTHRPNHRTVPVKIHFSEVTYALMCQELNLIYSSTKPPYGTKSALVDQLVKDWLTLRRDERRQEPEPPTHIYSNQDQEELSNGQ